MCIFVNSLKGKATTEFFDLLDKIFNTWFELICWFKSTFRSIDNLDEYLKCFNNLAFKENEIVKAFNLLFMKFFNRILKAI